MLDPLHHAVRRDVADIRLADRVFAPHYAAPMLCRTNVAVGLLADAAGLRVLASLNSGDLFEVLDLSGDFAWGIAVTLGIVGYVDRAALEAATR